MATRCYQHPAALPPTTIRKLGSLNIMHQSNRLVSHVADLQEVIEQIRLEIMDVSVATFLGRTDEDAIDDLNLIHESLLAVLAEASRAQRKRRTVAPSAPVTIAVTTTAA